MTQTPSSYSTVMASHLALVLNRECQLPRVINGSMSGFPVHISIRSYYILPINTSIDVTLRALDEARDLNPILATQEYNIHTVYCYT